MQAWVVFRELALIITPVFSRSLLGLSISDVVSGDHVIEQPLYPSAATAAVRNHHGGLGKAKKEIH